MNYYLRKSGAVSGPFPEEDLRRRLTLNLLTSMDEASTDGRSWKRIRQTPLWNPAAAPTPQPRSSAFAGASGQGGASRPGAATTPAALHLRRMAKQSALGGTSPTGTAFQVGQTQAASPAPVPVAPQPAASRTQEPAAIPERFQNPFAPAETPTAPAREKGRFHNWWLALAIPCATLVIIYIIGALMPAEPIPGTQSESRPPSSTGETEGPVSTDDSGRPDVSAEPSAPPADDGYRGAEITHLQLDQFKPELHDFLLYITPSYSELKQAYQMVLSSDHVSENLAYANATRDVRFYHDPSQDVINAFATVVDSWHREEPEFWPSIMVCGGAGRFARVIGAALTELGDELDMDALLGALGSVGSLDNEQARLILADALHVPMERYSDPAWLSRAKGVSRGILMSILAHETGHIALGHVWAWQKNKERNRNQEREADSFAHSIASGTADAEIMFFGNFLFHYAYAINEGRDENSAMAQTHPYAEERLYNLIRDNKSIADLYGITESEIREQLREVRSKFR